MGRDEHNVIDNASNESENNDIDNVRVEANFHCQRCGQERRTHLSVHHKTYDHIGSELQYPEDIEVLCQRCHMEEHGIEWSKDE